MIRSPMKAKQPPAAIGVTYKSSIFCPLLRLHGGKGIGTTLMFGALGMDPQDGELARATAGTSRHPDAERQQVDSSQPAMVGATGKPAVWRRHDLQQPDLGGVYYQATKSLKMVLEGNSMTSSASYDPSGGEPDDNTAFTGAFGLMLFY
jgi:hypothetical protein